MLHFCPDPGGSSMEISTIFHLKQLLLQLQKWLSLEKWYSRKSVRESWTLFQKSPVGGQFENWGWGWGEGCFLDQRPLLAIWSTGWSAQWEGSRLWCSSRPVVLVMTQGTNDSSAWGPQGPHLVIHGWPYGARNGTVVDYVQYFCTVLSF